MQITLDNKIKIQDATQGIKDNLIALLRHKNPVFLEAQKLGKSTYKINEYINYFEFDTSGNMYIPRGMRETLFLLLKQHGVNCTTKDNRTLNYDIGYIDSSEINYREYQRPALDKLLSGGPEGIMVAPAGSGKTVMGLSLIPITMQPTLWLTHTDRLFKQSHDRCIEFLPGLKDVDIGMIGANKWDTGDIVTFAMIQTLIRNLDRLCELKDNFGMVILDECHHSPASTFFEVISQLNPYFIYGLTATAYRRDGLEELMFQSIGPIRSEITTDDVAKYNGIILPTILYCPINYGPTVNINNIPSIFKYHIIYNMERNTRIKNDVIREAKAGNCCIVALGRRNHCDILYDMIRKEWSKTGIATGKYSKKKVDAQVEAFDKKEITVLICTSELLGEGFDVDFLNRLFIASPFRTESRAEQLIGRVQRFHPDKEDSIVYDYVDENIGVLKNQFYSKYGKCRNNVYKRLGLSITSYEKYYDKKLARKGFND